jgi:asparagine synthase (glutamine-hydrolysing)
MCGIAGIIQRDPSIYNESHLKKMTAALSHRGPDGDGHWVNETGQVLFGHRRLSIIDLSAAGKQPMHYRERYTIIHNGEIYNYIELKEELTKKGYSFRSHTDTEVIAAAYDHWEEACVDYFDGMFSFAIWDVKLQEFFAARDRFGEKPFFYSFDGNNLVFGSEMKALWSAGIARNPNLKMLFNFLTIGYVDNPADPGETFFENIHKLPASSSLKYSLRNAELSISRYWDLDNGEENKTIKDTEAIEQFNELFSISIKRRLRSDVAIGTSLSGGLDSSSVVATVVPIVQHSAGNADAGFSAFTAAFPNYEKDESQLARQVADQFHLNPFCVNVSAEGLIADWEKISYHQEEPFGSASIYAQYKVFELAEKNNVRVLMDGQGADETLAGYHKYYKWYWQELFIKRKLLRSGELKASKANGVRESFGYKNIIASIFPDLASVILERQYLLNALRHEDLNREFVKLQSKEAYYSTPTLFNLNGALYFNTIVHGLEELLRYADRNAMAHGREPRLPFLSHELVEFLFSLPSKYKIRNGWTKWLLRQSMQNKLPDSIVWRKDKTGFEPPQKTWMQHPGIQEMVNAAKTKLVNEKVLSASVLNKPVVAQSAHEAGNYDWRYLSAAMLFK